jgi:Arc/MetJ-type ribon-helix-helix transcriptional regulator
MPRPELYPVKKIVGFDPDMIAAIDKWRSKQKPVPNASEAIRQLVGHALSSQSSKRRSAAATKTASAMAERAIDRLADTSAPSKEQASRKKRLLEGPKEFRAMIANPRKGKRS